MFKFTKYGNPPYSLVLVHGGPGARGELRDLSLNLSENIGVLEPYQTEDSIEALLRELDKFVSEKARPPVKLIGFSWGAWLSAIYAAKNNQKVKKLILISCPPLVKKYALGINKKRLGRLGIEERERFLKLSGDLEKTEDTDIKNKIFKRISQIVSKTDSFDPEPSFISPVRLSYTEYLKVWKEAETLRESGKLIELFKKIETRLVVIHGDYDPHPYNGVKKPLSELGKDARFILLKDCGHYPWREKNAKKEFYRILFTEVD